MGTMKKHSAGTMVLVLMGCGAAVAVTAVACCRDKTPETVVGFIGEDTSMHVLVVDGIGGEEGRATFALDDATDLREAYGLLAGNVVEVTYAKPCKEEIPVAAKVVCSKDYADAIGRWVMPDPIEEDGVMGVELLVGGKARSINMATLPYASWELQGDPGKLILRGQSIGNGQTIDVTDTAVLAESGGVRTLTIEGAGVVYVKAE